MTAATVEATQPILRFDRIAKHFPGVQALDDVSFDVYPGEVHALVGENGAGKSTLMNLLGGDLHLDSGSVWLNGAVQHISTPRVAQDLGIAFVHQELDLTSNLSVAGNMFLGREKRRLGGLLMDWPTMEREAKRELDLLGVAINPSDKLGSLEVAKQQLTAIAKALLQNAKIIIMDEPNSALTPMETRRLFEVIRQLRQRGVTILYVSHRLEEVFEIADRITVLRDGRYIGTSLIKDITIPEVIRMMVGRTLSEAPTACQADCRDQPVALEVRHLHKGKVLKDVSLQVHVGEVVGLAGLPGAGRTELLRSIFGLDKVDSGTFVVGGKTIKPSSAAAGIKNGVAMVTSDRRGEGILLSMGVKENVVSATIDKNSRLGFLDTTRIRRLAAEFSKKIDIRMASLDQRASTLSGGNQQKVIVARWMATGPKVLLLDEPTRGIDVGAKAEIYRILHDLAAQGLAILVSSSELPELMRECDRILVMCRGEVSGEFSREEASPENLMAHMVGVGRN